MATYGTTWDTVITSSSSSNAYVKLYIEEEPKKPYTPEQWLRNRVKEICDLVDFK